MRYLFLFFTLTALAADPSGKLTVLWDPIPAAVATNGAVVFIYHTTNVALPMTNWTRIASVPAINSQINVQVTPGVNYFAATVSNFWGESFFSNVTNTPPLHAVRDNKLTVRRND